MGDNIFGTIYLIPDGDSLHFEFKSNSGEKVIYGTVVGRYKIVVAYTD